MARSIMHGKQDGTCYLCMKLHGDYGWKSVLHEHHVMFGHGSRKLSERYGLKIYLCLQHHTYDGGAEAVHRNNEIRRYTEAEAQKAFEAYYPNLDFRKIFGRNAIDEADRQQVSEETKLEEQTPAAGFCLLDDPVPPPDW